MVRSLRGGASNGKPLPPDEDDDAAAAAVVEFGDDEDEAKEVGIAMGLGSLRAEASMRRRAWDRLRAFNSLNLVPG